MTSHKEMTEHAVMFTYLLAKGISSSFLTVYQSYHLSVAHILCVIVHSAEDVNSIYKESNSIKKLRHKNIVELYHAFVEGK